MIGFITCTRRLEIDAGHRLLKHEGKCRNYHGHRYVFEITCRAPELDKVGRVVDFSVIREKVGAWLDDQLDHGMILQKGDPLLEKIADLQLKFHVVEFPPTSENLARYVFQIAQSLFSDTDVEVVHVRCWETPNCFSDYGAGRT